MYEKEYFGLSNGNKMKVQSFLKKVDYAFSTGFQILVLLRTSNEKNII